jgi:VWFA-related protein
VRGLGPDDFEVLDNGVSQQIDLVSFEQIPLNVIVVLDMSASVAGERLDHLRGGGNALLDALHREDQAAVVTFSERVRLGTGLTGDLAQARAALERAEPSGATSLVDASYAGMMLAESDVGRALVIVFSDGLDTSSWLTPPSVLDAARRADAVVYAVSVGGGPPFLRELSSLTGGSLVEVESTRNLGATFLKILEEFRQRYLVSYAPRGVSKDGWHRLEVRVKGRRAAVKARPGYLAGSD